MKKSISPPKIATVLLAVDISRPGRNIPLYLTLRIDADLRFRIRVMRQTCMLYGLTTVSDLIDGKRDFRWGPFERYPLQETRMNVTATDVTFTAGDAGNSTVATLPISADFLLDSPLDPPWIAYDSPKSREIVDAYDRDITQRAEHWLRGNGIREQVNEALDWLHARCMATYRECLTQDDDGRAPDQVSRDDPAYRHFLEAFDHEGADLLLRIERHLEAPISA